MSDYPQRCKVCNRADRFSFLVSDDTWKLIVPKHYANGVVCLSCFDYFASIKGIGYEKDLSDVIFVGEAAHFEFTITSRNTSYKLAM